MTAEKLIYTTIVNGLSIPTLMEMSLVAISKQLLQEEEVKNVFYKRFSIRYPEDYNGEKDGMSLNIMRKLTSLCKLVQLPDILQAKLVSCFLSISDQYFNWIQFIVQDFPRLKNQFPSQIEYITHIMNSTKWNQGVIATAKSVQQFLSLKLVKDDDLHTGLFSEAAQHFLENDARVFWERMSAVEKNRMVQCCGGFNDFYMLYWICKIEGDMTKFNEGISGFVKKRLFLEGEMDYKDPYICALVLHIFEGEIFGVKYFNELANVDIEQIAPITRLYLKYLNDGEYFIYQTVDKVAEKLLFLLRKIDDEIILKDIFNEHFKVFLKISVQYWPWHKGFFPLVKTFVDRIDQDLLLDLITQLSKDVKTERADIFFAQVLWNEIPHKMKNSFCLLISKKQIKYMFLENNDDVKILWKNMPIEIFDMILKDEEWRNVLTPYGNYGISLCIYVGRYDLIEFWLKKCLVTEEAIITYLKHFMQTKFVGVMKKLQSRLNLVIKFLNWISKYEDSMDKDELFKLKDEAIDKNIIQQMFVKGLDTTNWEDLKKLIDWIMRNRSDEYENRLISIKLKAIKEVFMQIEVCHFFYANENIDSLHAFLSYRIKDSGKLMVMMSKVNVNVGKFCSYFLKCKYANNCDVIYTYLKFWEGYGKDIFLLKGNIFNYIFNRCKENHFKEEKFCENIRNLLHWNCESDDKMKSEEMKKTIIKKYGPENILKCVRNKWDVAMNNILLFLFEDKMEDEEWLKMLFELKMKAIEKLNGDDLLKKECYYYDVILLMNWGEENEYIRNGNQDLKKCFIECLKNNIKEGSIPALIMEFNFVCFFLQGNIERYDFDKMLADLKVLEVLVERVINIEDDEVVSFYQLLKYLENIFNFLNLKGFNEACIEDLKIKILIRLFNGIKTDKIDKLCNFFDWCISKSSDCDWMSDILNLKEGVLNMIVSKYSDYWNEEYFQRLDEFLLHKSTGCENALKRIVVEKYAGKSCSHCLNDGNLTRVIDLIQWANIKDKESIKNFKRDILIEMLNVENFKCSKSEDYLLFLPFDFYDDSEKFLYGFDNPDPVEIATMKLDLLEIHFLTVFAELLPKKDEEYLLSFLEWAFDKHVKSAEFFPRTQKLIKEMAEKFGKEYCVLMLMKTHSHGLTYFWNLCIDFRVGIEKTNLDLWNFKKECINQVLKDKTLEDKNDWEPFPDDDFWNCLNKFMSLSCKLKDLRKEIFQFKDFISQTYGIVYMAKYFKYLSKFAYSFETPRNFLKWLFGKKNTTSGIYLNKEKLFEFKKKVLETLINIKHKDLLKNKYFYQDLNNFLKFNSPIENLNAIQDLKKSVCEVQGIELCIKLMSQNNVIALGRFLRWVRNLFGCCFIDFKLAVLSRLAGNLSLMYSWKSLELFLKNGLDLNREIDMKNYLQLKKWFSDFCNVNT